MTVSPTTSVSAAPPPLSLIPDFYLATSGDFYSATSEDFHGHRHLHQQQAQVAGGRGTRATWLPDSTGSANPRRGVQHECECRHAIIGKSRLTDVVISPPLDPWAALADGTRRAIFKRLTSRPMAVGELARELPVSRPAVSQHLKVLKSAGLVQDRAAGTRRLYHVNPEGVAALRAALDTFWDQTLDTYNNLVEQEGHPR